MPARIHVTSGPSAGQAYWLELEVTRIGGSDTADISLPEAPPQCATLLFRDGQYRLINRSDRPLGVGREICLPGQSAHWRPGQVLSLTGVFEAELLCEDDPAPAPAPRGLDGATQDPRPDLAAVETSGNIGLWVVLVGCVLAMGFFLLSSMPSGPPVLSEAETFDWLARELHKRHRPKTPDRRALKPVLFQEARVSELRGLYGLAVAKYGTLRDDLLAKRSQQEKLSRFENRLLAFLTARLEVVGPLVR